MEKIRGFKVTNGDMACRGFQYEIGKLYEHNGEISLYNAGFHFCQHAQHCFNFYDFDTKNKVFEIEASGKIEHGNDKSVCSKIKLIREIPWDEVLKIANTGSNNTGHSNSGDGNSGDGNSGDRNSGNWNSGDRNSGDGNSGDGNSGDRNSGNWNSGNWNSGDRNSGDRNSGDGNSGDGNSGDGNSGDGNSGNWNSGDRNSGDWNSGDGNSGDGNSGDGNSGNWNSGDRNSGDSNNGYRNSGAFCTDNDPILYLFNKPSNMTVKEWETHPAYRLMYYIDSTIWVYGNAMTDDEKKKNPKWETTDGYLKTIPMKDAWANFWHKLSNENKKLFTTLQNFDAKIFEEITGIKTI